MRPEVTSSRPRSISKALLSCCWRSSCEWGEVWCEELCGSRRVLFTEARGRGWSHHNLQDLHNFCRFQYFFYYSLCIIVLLFIQNYYFFIFQNMNASFRTRRHIREFFMPRRFEKRAYDNKENGQRAATSAFFCRRQLGTKN